MSLTEKAADKLPEVTVAVGRALEHFQHRAKGGLPTEDGAREPTLSIRQGASIDSCRRKRAEDPRAKFECCRLAYTSRGVSPGCPADRLANTRVAHKGQSLPPPLARRFVQLRIRGPVPCQHLLNHGTVGMLQGQR